MHRNRMFKVCRLWSSLLLLGLAGCSAEAGPLAQEESTGSVQQAATTQAAGFVLIEGVGGGFNALPAFSMNSTGATNTVTWLPNQPGRARVDFPGLGNELGGNVQVTAFASFGQRCQVEGWGPSGTTLQVWIRCNNVAGTPTNLPFTASYVRRAGTPGQEGGYVWANQPSAAINVPYTPSLTYQWNSAGGDVSITHTGTGSYSVLFPNQNFFGGTVEVTAYGAGTDYCKVQNWGPASGGQQVNVRCFTTNGTPWDTLFTAKFTRGSLNNTGSFAYAWASDPSNPNEYTPSTTYQLVSLTSGCGQLTRGPVTIKRSQTGKYAVKFNGFPTLSNFPSHVKVTAYGSGGQACRINSWGGSTNTVADVSCFDAAGNAADSYFTISLSSTIFIIC